MILVPDSYTASSCPIQNQGRELRRTQECWGIMDSRQVMCVLVSGEKKNKRWSNGVGEKDSEGLWIVVKEGDEIKGVVVCLRLKGKCSNDVSEDNSEGDISELHIKDGRDGNEELLVYGRVNGKERTYKTSTTEEDNKKKKISGIRNDNKGGRWRQGNLWYA